jgi:hypothetical protein
MVQNPGSVFSQGSKALQAAQFTHTLLGDPNKDKNIRKFMQKSAHINKTHKVHAPKFKGCFSEGSEASQAAQFTRTLLGETKKPANRHQK